MILQSNEGASGGSGRNVQADHRDEGVSGTRMKQPNAKAA
jgi:hypothetical protein